MAATTSERITDHLDAADITLQGVLEALSDPVRRKIVRQIADSTEDVACGTFDIAVSRSTGAHHFKTLRQTGIIRQRYVGTVKLNSLRRDDLDRALPGLLDAILNAAGREARDAR